jgi:stage II sporulation protein D
MIKRSLKKVAAIILSTVLLTAVFRVNAETGQLSAADSDIIRVGLYYKGSSVNTAQSIFDVSAQSGVTAGFVNGEGAFTPIFTYNSPSSLYVRKDAYYQESGGGLKETKASGSGDGGRKFGPFHIKIGSDHPDAASALSNISVFRQLGVDAYIAYNDAWQVWAGSCMDEEEANRLMLDLKNLLGEAGYEIIKPSSDRIVVADGQHQTMCIFGSKSSLFQIRPVPGAEPAAVNIKGEPYRGAVEVRRLPDSDMTIINVVTVREYLYGNVPPEIGGRSPAEALKAQAVVSKMYAINNRGKHGSSGFDLCATTHCQVYRGLKVELPECNKLIDEVYERLITYEGKPVDHVYYFASGGGSTEDVRNVWGSSYPYLVSVKDDYEKIYTWTKTLRASDIKSKLPELGTILGVTITRTAPTGRVTELAVTGSSRGEPLYFSNERCRTLFGLDSQLYTITTDADVFVAGFKEFTAVSEINSPDAGENSKDAGSNETVGVTEGESASGNEAKAGSAEAAASAQDAGSGPDGQQENQADGKVQADQGNGDPGTDGAGNGSQQSGETVETDEEKQAWNEPALPAVVAPTATEPIKTQLGGKKVVTASGVKTVSGEKNKVTIMGADGAVTKAAVVPETYTFTGKGWGHAVGMSQEGAIGMAKAGMTYKDIITYYFQGTKVE